LKHHPINIDFYPKNSRIGPPLLLAAMRGDLKLIKELLTHGPDLSKKYWYDVLGENVTLVNYLSASVIFNNKKETVMLIKEAQDKYVQDHFDY